MSAARTQRQTAPAPEPQAAIPAIIRLFDQHDVVMLGAVHGCIQFDELLKRLVTTPAFADRVTDVVVEMGNARYQDVLDRYIAGEDVNLEQLRRSWQDVLGAPNGIPVPPYHGLYAAVREFNRTRPKDRRIRILAGDPPIDWDTVRTPQDVAPFRNRDAHYAGVVRDQVLARGHKALLVMGSLHFERQDGKPSSIETQLRAAHSTPYVVIAGSDIVATYADVDPRFVQNSSSTHWPWLMPLPDTWLGRLPLRADSPWIGLPAATSSAPQIGTWADAADAYLFLGPRDSLTAGGEAFDLEGTPYGAELRRRWTILGRQQPDRLPRSDGAVRPLYTKPPSVDRSAPRVRR